MQKSKGVSLPSTCIHNWHKVKSLSALDLTTLYVWPLVFVSVLTVRE